MICLSVGEAKELQKELRALREEKEALVRRLAELESQSAEAEKLRARLKELEETPVEKVVEKVVYRADPALEKELEATREHAAKLVEEVVIVEGDEEYLEYLLIADNEERRFCRDPIKKAKRAEFLRRYWGVREGAGRPKKLVQNALINSGETVTNNQKTLSDIAEAIGEGIDTTKRLLKFNDLIPELQQLVSQGKLSQRAAYSLAFLPPEKGAEFLRRYWGVREGSLSKPGTPEGHFVPQAKTLADVAEAVGETEKNLKRLLKLNDLIPELQQLVSQDQLSGRAAYSLALLPAEERRRPPGVLGEADVCG